MFPKMTDNIGFHEYFDKEEYLDGLAYDVQEFAQKLVET